MNILGISAFYHDSAASIVVNGQLIAAVQEERFSRKKHDEQFPIESIKYCLSEAKLELSDIDYICFYEKPFLKFERLLETYISYAPFKGFKSFMMAMPIWLQYKLNLKSHLRKKFKDINDSGLSEKTKLLFSYHHLSHASSAYFASPFNEAAVLCVDGVGEWETTTTWMAKDNNIKPLEKINFPHSLGLFYSSFTYFCGFKVNSGEYKLMGLAPYGEPKYVDLILENLIHIQEDGSYKLNMNYFCYPYTKVMTDNKLEKLFGFSRRASETTMDQKYMDIAASVQKVLEIALVRMTKSLHKKTNCENLCLAGGVALNCVANEQILKESGFKNIWIQPAAGDAGGALGAALIVWHQYLNNKKQNNDIMQSCYLGPKYSDANIESELLNAGAKFKKMSEKDLISNVASKIEQGKVVGWFQGRMEYGPRALGARSILADPRNPEMQKQLNLKIKFRESFRPFAPITLEDDQQSTFDLATPSPYMLLTCQVKNSSLPAITHVNGSARLQTVTEKSNPKVYKLLNEFKNKTGCSTLINTSFNVRGEPIVRTPTDAYRCFMNSHIDELVIDNYYLSKNEQDKNMNLPPMSFEKD